MHSIEIDLDVFTWNTGYEHDGGAFLPNEDFIIVEVEVLMPSHVEFEGCFFTFDDEDDDEEFEEYVFADDDADEVGEFDSEAAAVRLKTVVIDLAVTGSTTTAETCPHCWVQLRQSLLALSMDQEVSDILC